MDHMVRDLALPGVIRRPPGRIKEFARLDGEFIVTGAEVVEVEGGGRSPWT